MIDIGVGEHGVLGHHIEGADAARAGPVHHLRHRQSDLVGEPVYIPSGLELELDLGQSHLLVAGIDVGQPAQVAGSLDVVLTTQRVDAAAGDAHIAGEHGQVGAGFDVVGAGGMLGDAHRIENGRRFVGGVYSRRRPQVGSGDGGDLLHPLRGVLHHHPF